MSITPDDLRAFELALEPYATGYSEGESSGRRWGMTIKRSVDGRRIWLFAEDLAGSDIVSFNLYRLAGGRPVLKPCEMSSDKVIDFVLKFQPDRCEFVDNRSLGKHAASI